MAVVVARMMVETVTAIAKLAPVVVVVVVEVGEVPRAVWRLVMEMVVVVGVVVGVVLMVVVAEVAQPAVTKDNKIITKKTKRTGKEQREPFAG